MTGRTIQSDENLFDIIELIREKGGAGVTDLASDLGLSKSTVHAHLTTLKRRGYVVNADGTYELGLHFFHHGITAQHEHPLYPMAKRKVNHLVRETSERAWCQVEQNGMAYYLCGAEGEQSVQPPVQLGEVVHLHQIAAGKAILAFLPEDRVERIVDRHGLPAQTEHTITDRDELLATLEEVRERGYAFNMEESLTGVHAVGAPIRVDGTVFGSLSVVGPAHRIKGDRLHEELPELLLGATNELQVNLSHP